MIDISTEGKNKVQPYPVIQPLIWEKLLPAAEAPFPWQGCMMSHNAMTSSRQSARLCHHLGVTLNCAERNTMQACPTHCVTAPSQR